MTAVASILFERARGGWQPAQVLVISPRIRAFWREVCTSTTLNGGHAMYAQIRKYHSLRAGRTATQVAGDIERTACARFAQIPGFVEYLVVELNDGGLLTLSIYEDRAGVEAGKKASADWNKTESAGAVPETPDETFEGPVRVHHRAITHEAV